MNQSLNRVAKISQAHARSLWSWISLAIELVEPWNIRIRVSYIPNYKASISAKITCWEGEQFPLKHRVTGGLDTMNWKTATSGPSSCRRGHYRPWKVISSYSAITIDRDKLERWKHHRCDQADDTDRLICSMTFSDQVRTLILGGYFIVFFCCLDTKPLILGSIWGHHSDRALTLLVAGSWLQELSNALFRGTVTHLVPELCASYNWLFCLFQHFTTKVVKCWKRQNLTFDGIWWPELSPDLMTKYVVA